MNSHHYINEKLTSNKPLSSDQIDFLKNITQLRQFGFTQEHAISWQGICYQEHINALAYLCKNGSSPQQAVRMVSYLNCSQAEGITKGLARDEVDYLNPDQIRSLVELKSFGLTADDLRSWQGKNKFKFRESYYKALRFLIVEKKKNPITALDEINQLTPDEAEFISQGLTRIQVVGLNRYQHTALIKLQSYGLTADHLLNWKSAKKSGFYLEHCKVLEKLIIECHFDAEKAVNEINELSGSEAIGMAKGLSRTEVLGLQEGQIKALAELKNEGFNELTAEHLREWQGDYFSNSHQQAIKQLIVKRGYSGPDAVKELNNLDEFEARMIAQKGLIRDEVVGFNGWQVDLLQQLKGKGLNPGHLRSWKKPNDDEKFLNGLAEAVIYLMNKGMSAEVVMEEINGLTDDQAQRIAQGETRQEVLRNRPFYN